MWLALFKILYWLIVGSIPFFPIYLNQRLLENMDCPYGSDCFVYEISFIPAQFDFFDYFIVTALAFSDSEYFEDYYSL
jgi:hypothetical protein